MGRDHQRQNVDLIYIYPCIENWTFKKRIYFSFLMTEGAKGAVGHRIQLIYKSHWDSESAQALNQCPILTY